MINDLKIELNYYNDYSLKYKFDETDSAPFYIKTLNPNMSEKQLCDEYYDYWCEMILHCGVGAVLDLLQKRENSGDKYSVSVLAKLYLYGSYMNPDRTKGIYYADKAINYGCGNMALEIAQLYGAKKDNILPYDSKLKFEYLKRAVDKGCKDAYWGLANCYMLGDGTKTDEANAFKYYDLAYSNGYKEACYGLALCYVDGLGTRKNSSKAITLLEETLQLTPNNASAMTSMARCLADPYEEYGISPTYSMYSEAVRYARMGYEKGDIDACRLLGCMYLYGKGVQRDFNLAYSYLDEGRRRGDTDNQRLLRWFLKDEYGNYYIPEENL